MEEEKHDYNWAIDDARQKILREILAEVIFDGWSEPALKNAVTRAKVDPDLAKLAFPRGPIDVVVYLHRQGDNELIKRIPSAVSPLPRMRDQIAEAVIMRLDIASPYKEELRRAASLLALPQHLATGAGLIWETSDNIWCALGDSDKGFSHYTKRTTLGSIYSASFLYWLQDENPIMSDTRAFLDRRIDELMQFHKFKNSFLKPMNIFKTQESRT